MANGTGSHGPHLPPPVTRAEYERLRDEVARLKAALGRSAYLVPNPQVQQTASEPLSYDYIIVFPNGSGLTQKGRMPVAPTPEHAEAHAARAMLCEDPEERKTR